MRGCRGIRNRFADYLNAADWAGLRVTGCREWRPQDFGAAAPAKALKRGPDSQCSLNFYSLNFYLTGAERSGSISR